jgi:hypothetical protein
MGHEIYSEDQARNHARAMRNDWQRMNPGMTPPAGAFESQRMFNGQMQNRVVMNPIPNYLNEPNVVVIPVEGENVAITFNKNSQDAMNIVAGLKGTSDIGKGLNNALMIPRMFSSWVRAMSTGFNPVFAVFNALRDVQGAGISLGADKIPGWTARDSGSLIADFVPFAASISKQLKADFDALQTGTRAPAPATGSPAYWMELLKAEGGATGIAQSAQIDDVAAQVRRLFGASTEQRRIFPNEVRDAWTQAGEMVVSIGDRAYRFGEGDVKGGIMGFLSQRVAAGVGRINETAELATRTMVFQKAAEKFMADGQPRDVALKMAANIAKNASTNFNRRGNLSGVANQLFPFFNAAAQGSARLAETLFEKETYTTNRAGHVVVDQKTRLTPFGQKALAAIASAGVLQAALLLAAGFKEDDIPEAIRDRAFIVPTGGKSYIAIPMPHGFNMILNFGREMTSAAVATAQGDFKKAGKHMANGTARQLFALNPTGSAGNWTTDLAPAIIDMPLSLAMNKDAFGRPIAREDIDQTNPTPGFTRAKEGASGFGRSFVRGMNAITGGNDYQKGIFSPTPDQVDFVTGQLTGGVGREAGKLGSTAWQGVQTAAGVPTEAIPLHKRPLISRIMGDAGSPTALRGQLFTARTEINEKYAQYKGLLTEGKRDEAEAYLAKNPEITLRSSIEGFARYDAKLKKQRALARKNDEIERVNQLTTIEDAKVNQLMDKYRELRP